MVYLIFPVHSKVPPALALVCRLVLRMRGVGKAVVFCIMSLASFVLQLLAVWERAHGEGIRLGLAAPVGPAACLLTASSTAAAVGRAAASKLFSVMAHWTVEREASRAGAKPFALPEIVHVESTRFNHRHLFVVTGIK